MAKTSQVNRNGKRERMAARDKGKRAALKARGHAMTAEARTSSAILAMLPVVTGGMLYVINPSYMMILFTDPTGKMFFSAAVISLICGMLCIRAIIKAVLP